MRMRKRSTLNPRTINHACVTALSREAVTIALLFKVNDSDNEAEFDPFFIQRIKSALDSVFFDELNQLKENLRNTQKFRKLEKGE